MRRLLFMAAALLSGCNAGLAQVSTMGTTAMGLPSTPGAIVTSPLNGPSPFSATTQPGAPDTTLAPVPLASDPTTPGTVVTCSTPTGQLTPGTLAVPVTSMSAIGGATGPMPSISAVQTTSAIPATGSASASGSTATPYLTLSAQPATSSTSDFPGSTIPAPQPPAPPPLPSPSIAAMPVPAPSTVYSPVPTFLPSTAATMAPAAALGSIPTPVVN